MTVVKLKQPKYLLSFKNYTEKKVWEDCASNEMPIKTNKEKKRNSLT